MNNEIKAYSARYECAAKELAAATARIFPVGSVVSATIGRSRIRGKVVSSGGCWWARPDQVTIQNERTGKFRHVEATSSIADVDLDNTGSLPPEGRSPAGWQ